MKKTRSTPPLRFSNGFAEAFATPIPECFDEAIRREALSQGDIFYSSVAAYQQGSWGDAVKHTEWALQIRESMTGGQTVLFERFVRSDTGNSLVSDGVFKLHWDEFLERLKSGNFANISPIKH